MAAVDTVTDQKINKKRHGHHHSKGRDYLKVYWPYVPLLLVSIFSVLLLTVDNTPHRGVLAYATDMSVSSLLNVTNQQRNANNVSVLRLNKNLATAAQAKADDMAARNYWSHTTPDGEHAYVFVKAAGYDYQKTGENLAYGFASSQDVITGWMSSPEHKANLLDSSYVDVGFGYTDVANYQGMGPQTIVVAEYGAPAGGPAVKASTADANHLLTSVNTTANEPSTSSVKRIQILTNGATWGTLLVGIAGGAAITILIFKHGFAIRKMVVKGEHFFMHHPMFDAVLLATIVVAYFLSSGNGFIR